MICIKIWYKIKYALTKVFGIFLSILLLLKKTFTVKIR